MRCKKLIAIVICMVICTSLWGCEEIYSSPFTADSKEEESAVLRIGFMSTHEVHSAAWESYRIALRKQEVLVNQFLQDRKNYQVEFTLISSDEPLDSLQQFDLIDGPRILTPTELDQWFVDIATELKSGKLKPMYKSMPKDYWKTVTSNGHIYSTGRFLSNTIHSLRITDSLLLEANVAVPKKLIGKPLAEWMDFFAEVYEGLGEKPFIQSPFGSGWISPVLNGNGWESHFQLVTPCLGIDYENPKQGVICIYESDYADNMQNLWMQMAELGYIVGDMTSLSNKEKVWHESNDIMVECLFDAQPYEMEEGVFSYPLQKEIYGAPMVSSLRQYWQLIPKGAAHYEQLCDFLIELSIDKAFRTAVCTNEEGDAVIFLTEQSTFLGNAGTLLWGTPEQNEETVMARLEDISKPAAEGFDFDITAVDKQVAAMEAVLEAEKELFMRTITEQEGISFISMADPKTWNQWDEKMADLITKLYEAGMQDVIDEANRQLALH